MKKLLISGGVYLVSKRVKNEENQKSSVSQLKDQGNNITVRRREWI